MPVYLLNVYTHKYVHLLICEYGYACLYLIYLRIPSCVNTVVDLYMCTNMNVRECPRMYAYNTFVYILDDIVGIILNRLDWIFD